MFSKTKKILVVDDDDYIRLILTDMLTNEGYAVTESKNGIEALQKKIAGQLFLLLKLYQLIIQSMKRMQSGMNSWIIFLQYFGIPKNIF